MDIAKILAVLVVAATAACGQSETTVADREDGVYGASSGANPNLEDLQRNQRNDARRSEADPATPGENAYPSTMGDPGEASAGGEGGRGSAETGATDN